MKKTFLIIVILAWVSQSYSQNNDLLTDNSVAVYYIFYTFMISEWDDRKQEWIHNASKAECNHIYFGIPKSVNMVEYYKSYWKDKDPELHQGGLLQRFSRAMSGYSNCGDGGSINLRIHNYKNIQSSIELITQDTFSATGELDSGEKCNIYRSQIGETLTIQVGNLLYSYY
jgi:hypothetical protein